MYNDLCFTFRRLYISAVIIIRTYLLTKTRVPPDVLVGPVVFPVESDRGTYQCARTRMCYPRDNEKCIYFRVASMETIVVHLNIYIYACVYRYVVVYCS